MTSFLALQSDVIVSLTLKTQQPDGYIRISVKYLILIKFPVFRYSAITEFSQFSR